MIHYQATTFRSLPSADTESSPSADTDPCPAPYPFPTPEEAHARDIEMLCALDNEDFASDLVTIIQRSDPRTRFKLLYEPAIKARVAAVLADELVSEGILWPGLRAVPGFREAAYLRALRGGTPTSPTTTTYSPEILTMAAVTERPIDWLWYPYIAKGEVTVLDGDPGLGKGLLTMQLAASLSRGFPLPDQTGQPTLATGAPQSTLVINAEDSPDATIKKRLRQAGADDNKVHVLTGWHHAGEEPGSRAFTLQDMPVLENALALHAYALVILDPLQAYLGPIDMHRANQTRPLMAQLKQVAAKYHCAIVCVRHPAKPGQSIGKALHRGLGSIDMIGAARTGLFVEQHPVDPSLVLLCQMKSNIGPLGRTQTFTKTDGEFRWGTPSRLSAEQIAGSGRGPDPYAFFEAALWLEQALADCTPQPATALFEQADQDDITPAALKRAKKALGVLSRRVDNRWDWHLPPLPVVAAPLPPQTVHDPNTLLALLEPLESAMQETQEVQGTEVIREMPVDDVPVPQDDVPVTALDLDAAATIEAPVVPETLPNAPALAVSTDLWFTTPAAGPVCARCHGQAFDLHALTPPTCRQCGTLAVPQNGYHQHGRAQA